MEGLRMGQDPMERQSGALLEGFEWGRFSSVERRDSNLVFYRSPKSSKVYMLYMMSMLISVTHLALILACFSQVSFPRCFFDAS
jgi:hypothetical protein